jgi:hypothetical protein
MLIETLKLLFERDLNKLKSEIELYKNEQRIWYIEKGIPNSAGNLCLHLVGNLNTFIGAQIGKTNYVRNREQEFSLKDISRADLVRKIEETIAVVNTSLGMLRDEELQNDFPIIVFEKKTSTEYMLIHLATHLGYHLGQVNYHRRLLDV